ncbi:recombinase RecT [Clostridium kluyveri]|uniref:Recombinase RecT n=1 Tax=Clostridium kluyveri TaxID=1534 RepID=A0A1L5F8X9_CLOKL|nr:recombinase RecT [Clostridium kluyveri]APM39427.1 hypothetical protein BS101_12075 [Clostridium kluyveri]
MGNLINGKPVEVKNILANINMQKRFQEILGKKAAGFMANLVNISNGKLKGIEPYSIVSSAMIAATLDLPIDPNLGFAWIVPYGKKAQFQMGYRGFVQLALRTGQYKHINVIEIYKGQLKTYNPLTEELELDFDSKESNEVVGYAAYFSLINGFEKTVYWSKEKVTAHGKKFSKTYNNGPWQTDFDAMAKKTILKNTLSKWGILSIDMQTALQADQATVKKGVLDGESVEVNLDYIDNPDSIDAEFEEVDSGKATTKLDDKFKKANGDSAQDKKKDDTPSEDKQENLFKGTPFEMGDDK